MKKLYQTALLTSLGLAFLSSAQAAIYSGDLIVGLTQQSGNDVIYDLGAAASLFGGESWDLSSQLSGFNLNNTSWGVVGDVSGSPRVAWTTTSDSGVAPGTILNNAGWSSKSDTPVKSIYSGFSTAGAGQFLQVSSSTDNSWNQQTINGALATQYHNAYENPNVTGLTSDSLWQVPANGGAPTLLGSFSLDASSVLHFDAVPEPSAGGLAGAGLLALCMCHQFRRKQA